MMTVSTSGQQGYPYRETDRQELAGTFIHETEHVKQFERYKGKPKLAERMFKGKYEKQPAEIQAREAERKATKERYEFNTGPYQFSPRYENPEVQEYLRKYPERVKRFEKGQKEFFRGYRRMMK